MNYSIKRSGLSIIEVLVAMLVATIGVFGVMIMIPFAINQAQKGLDSDIANGLGRNAIEKMKIYALFDEVPITDSNGIEVDRVLASIVFPSQELTNECETVFLKDVGQIVGNYSLKSLGLSKGNDYRNLVGMVHFDPIGVAYANGPITSFEVDGELNEPQIVIPSVTMRNGDTNTFSRNVFSRFSNAEARDFCSTADDLIFGEQRLEPGVGYVATTDLAPPQAYYDMNGNQPIKRQAEGRVTWSMMLNPTKNISLIKENAWDPPTRPSHFKAHVLTWRRRSFGEPVFSTRIENEPGKYGLGSSENRLPELRQLELDQLIPEKSSIKDGDWVMLINLFPLPDYETFSEPQLPLSKLAFGTRFRAEEPGYDKQVLFARVTNVDRTNIPNSVTIEESQFEIFPNPVARSSTWMVHLTDVINVYERSVSIER